MFNMPSASQLRAERSLFEDRMRDKQDDDWSNWVHFSVNGLSPLLGTQWRWEVLANNFERVGIYDTPKEASLVKAKLTYRMKHRNQGLIGMDGVDETPIRYRQKTPTGER